MPDSRVSVPIQTKLFLKLARFLETKGSDLDPLDAVGMAIEYWMLGPATNTARQDLTDDKDQAKVEVSQEDYWWKKVRIPAGSRARMTYRGKTHFADVTPSGFLFEGKLHSPSEFTWAVTSTARNAWRDIELKFPNSDKWIMADQLRHQAKIDDLI